MARIHVTTGLLDTIILSRLLGRTDAEIAAELCEMLGRNVSRPRVQVIRNSEKCQKRVSEIHACLETVLAIGNRQVGDFF